jgi:hypothetical protein
MQLASVRDSAAQMRPGQPGCDVQELLKKAMQDMMLLGVSPAKWTQLAGVFEANVQNWNERLNCCPMTRPDAHDDPLFMDEFNDSI